jgi:hypothetical protein
MVDLMIARDGHWFIQVCSIMTIVVTVLCLFGLLLTGSAS